jgi:tetratricopeptide (TPR) repeat protein
MRARALWLILGCVLIAGSWGPSRVRAEDTDAQGDVDTGRSHFKNGVDYYRDGDLGAALIEFKRAYAAAPNYRLLYNLGQVSHELLDYTNAQAYFQRYLSEGGAEIEAARRQEVETALAKIAARIANVQINCNLDGAELFIDDVSVGKSPLSEPVRVSAGTRRVSATLAGHPRITQVVEAAGGDTLVVKMEFPPLAQEAPSLADSSIRVESSGPSPALWLGIGTGALAVGAGVMAYLAYSDASDYRDAIHRKTTAQEVDSLHDRATTKALVTDILLGATVVGAAVTVFVALQGGDDEAEERPTASRTEARTELMVSPGSIGLSGSF